MATPKKTATGRWRIQIDVAGVRESATLDTKREAEIWAARKATELRENKISNAPVNKNLREALRRYADEVSPTKKGERWEAVRLSAFEQADHGTLPLDKKMGEITPADIAVWRDARLKQVARGTVLRDLALLGAVFECARREWGWCSVNVVRDVRKPANPDHRERVISGLEIRKMLRQLDWPKSNVRSVSQAVAVCFFVALQTGMRAGELCDLEWSDVMVTHLRIKDGKTGKRNVPLTPSTRRAIDRLDGWDANLVFGIKSQTLDALFRRARNRAGLAGFTFHDARHTAATRLAQKLHVLDLCKVFGWSNTSRALTYYNPTSADLAKRMA